MAVCNAYGLPNTSDSALQRSACGREQVTCSVRPWISILRENCDIVGLSITRPYHSGVKTDVLRAGICNREYEVDQRPMVLENFCQSIFTSIAQKTSTVMNLNGSDTRIRVRSQNQSLILVFSIVNEYKNRRLGSFCIHVCMLVVTLMIF